MDLRKRIQMTEIEQYRNGTLKLLETGINEDGYLELENGKLVHRLVAFHKIYLQHKDDYPLPFSIYQVHHIDENKLNNSPQNLELHTKEEHETLHGFSFKSEKLKSLN